MDLYSRMIVGWSMSERMTPNIVRVFIGSFLRRYGEKFHTREEAKKHIFESIEVYYNPDRLHSSIGYLSPENFEAMGA